MRVPRTGQYTLTVEHQRWDMGFRATYAGTNTRQGIYRRDINQPVADDRPYSAKPRPFPSYPGILYGDNGSGHQYHGFSVEVERRMKRGISYQAYYTFARDIGDLEHNESPEDAYDRRRERARGGRCPTHRFSANTILELPVGQRPAVRERHATGWPRRARRLEPERHLQLRAGQLHHADVDRARPDGHAFRRGRAAGQRHAAARTSCATRTSTTRPSPAGSMSGRSPRRPSGASARRPKASSFRTPINVFHASLAKQFFIKERVRLRFEVLGTNVLNHPNYAAPNTNITAGVRPAGDRDDRPQRQVRLGQHARVPAPVPGRVVMARGSHPRHPWAIMAVPEVNNK